MPPPAGPGQVTVLRTHYAAIGDRPVALIDETYHVENDGRDRFYVMAAVVVAGVDRDPLREAIDALVPDGYWHTSEQLRSDHGYENAAALLRTLEMPHDACVIVDHRQVEADDKDGLNARRTVLGRLLTDLHRAEGPHDPVAMAVLEEHRVARVNNLDRTVRAELEHAGVIPTTMRMVASSPGSEHLLWLPDLVCSAYRQKRLGRDGGLFDQIRDLTTVVQLP